MTKYEIGEIANATSGTRNQPPPSAVLRDYFTVGSTKDEVLAIQGTPTEFTDTKFTYGLSRVIFQSDKVKTWEESPINRLRVKLLPVTVVQNNGYFTVGSTKDEVLAVQGKRAH